MKKTYQITQSLLKEFANSVNCMQLSISDNITNIIIYKGKNYVITGSIGNASGYSCVMGNLLVMLHDYNGKLKPLMKSEHDIEVNFNKRERGYQGRLITFKNHRFVIDEEVEFKQILDEKKDEQLQLF